GALGTLPRVWAALGGLVLGAGLLATRAVNHDLRAHLWLSPPKVLPSQEVLAHLLHPEQLMQLPLRAAGQLWYLLAATLGVVLLGVLALTSVARQGSTLREPRAATAVFLLATAGAVLVAGAVFLLPAWRTDHFLYGRYNEGVLAPLLLAGFAAVLTWTPRRTLAGLAAGAAATAALAEVLHAGLAPAAFASPPNPLNVLGVLAFTGADGLRLGAVTACAVAATAALALLAAANRRAAVVAVALAFTLAAVAVETRVLRPFCHTWSELLALPDTLDRLGISGPLAYDAANPEPYGWNAYLFWRNDLVLDRFRSDRGDPGDRPPYELAIASRSWDGGRFGARLVYPETGVDQALWVLPGPWQERLAARGLLVPRDPSAPLPDAACRSALRLEETGPLRLAAGAARELTVAVEHRGSGARWFPAAATSEAAVQIADLPRVLLPGDRVELTLSLAARTANGAPLPRGRYRVRVGLLQEGYGWLDGRGDGAVEIPVEVD
ncbi:MAG TPA: hypothetical protein VGE98_11755, partial [Thermoanaerobaculia bacterium]